MSLSSTIIYTSELILSSTICVPSATRHNIHMYFYILVCLDTHICIHAINPRHIAFCIIDQFPAILAFVLHYLACSNT